MIQMYLKLSLQRRIVIESNLHRFYGTTSAMIKSMLPLPGLSLVSGKSVVATFDGGLLSSDGGVLMLREVEQRLRIADRLLAASRIRGHRTRLRTLSPTLSGSAS